MDTLYKVGGTYGKGRELVSSGSCGPTTVGGLGFFGREQRRRSRLSREET